jgi:hypothetical protein
LIPVLAVLAVVGFDRLIVSERWAAPVVARGVWLRWRSRVVAFVRAAPGTYAYLFVLLVTTWVLQTSSGNVARQLLAERSTNLHHLAHDAGRVLFASAFWLSSSLELLTWLVLFSAIVAPVEQWLGTARTALVFFVGHVCATLLVAVGLWLALRADVVESSVTRSTDVGASYGFAAVAAVLAYRLRGRARKLYLAGVVLVVAVGFAIDHGFTSWGHLLALLIGFACYPLVRGRFRARDSGR